MPRGSANQNGGILGKVNKTSFGKNKITSTTSTGNFTTQPGTTVLNVAVVGVVIVQESPVPAKAPGVWQMNTVYEFVKAGNWV